MLIEPQYEEPLDDGGVLRVFADRWEIEYYFPGPDQRYNATFLKYDERELSRLTEDYKVAYSKYRELKHSAAPGSELTLELGLRLTIRVGGHFDGVCLASYHDPINTDIAFQRRMRVYEMAQVRAHKVQQMLKAIA